MITKNQLYIFSFFLNQQIKNIPVMVVHIKALLFFSFDKNFRKRELYLSEKLKS